MASGRSMLDDTLNSSICDCGEKEEERRRKRRGGGEAWGKGVQKKDVEGVERRERVYI